MAIAFRAARFASKPVDDTAALSVTPPTGTVAGDLLLLVVTCYHSASTAPVINTPSGWTLIAAQKAWSTYFQTALFYRIAVASEPATSITAASAGQLEASVAGFSGVNQVTPIDVVPSAWAAATGGSTVTVPSLTTVTANAWWVTFSIDNWQAFDTSSKPSGWTQQHKIDGGSGANTIGGTINSIPVTTAGATTATSFPRNTTSGLFVSIGLALKAATITTANLGYPTNGGNYDGPNNGRMMVNKYTLASPATLTELHGWFYNSSGLFMSSNIVCYAADGSGGDPGTRMAYAQVTCPSNSSDNHLSQTGLSVPLPAGDYWIGWIDYGVSSPTTFFAKYDNGGTAREITGGAAYNPPPNPCTAMNNTRARIESCWGVVESSSLTAILGNNAVATGYLGVANNRVNVSKFTLTSPATLNELHGRIGFATGGLSVRLVIYKDTGGSFPSSTTLVAYSSPITPSAGDPIEFSETGFNVPLPAGDYWIGFRQNVPGGADGNPRTSSGGTYSEVNGVADPPPNPLSGSGGTAGGSNTMCCWAVVSAATVATSTFIPQIVIT